MIYITLGKWFILVEKNQLHSLRCSISVNNILEVLRITFFFKDVSPHIHEVASLLNELLGFPQNTTSSPVEFF